MTDDTTDDVITTGALLVGGAVAAYLGGRWLAGRQTSNAEPRPTDAAVTAAESTTGASTSRRFDSIFERHRGDVPIEFLRALAMKESGMNPAARGRFAWGLLQIVEVVRKDYNRIHHTQHPREALLDPEINVAIATWLLRTIIASYQRRHPDVVNLQPDWRNPRFVELLVYGWNAGWSEGGGVGLVAGWLAARGVTDITIDRVFESVRDAHASPNLASADRVRWAKGVANLYQRERQLAR